MAKKSKPGMKTGGPHLAAAFFCESISTDEQDHLTTAIRMLDTISYVIPQTAPPDFPSEERRLAVRVSGLVSFKTGDSPGEHRVQIVGQSPTGTTGTVLDQVITLPPQPQGGMNVRLHQVIQVNKGGLFWFHVLLDGEKVASMPLMIEVKREQAPHRQPAQG